MRRKKCFMLATLLIMGLSLTACGTDSPAKDNSTTTEAFTEDNITEDKEETEASEEADSSSTTEQESEEVTTEADVQADMGNSYSVTMYTTESISLHKEAAGSSEELCVVAVGNEVQAYETSGDYIRVLYDGKEGYLLKQYLTEDKETADKAAADSKKSQGSGSSKKSSDKKKKKDKECLNNGLLN
jgi:hypothetical protein